MATEIPLENTPATTDDTNHLTPSKLSQLVDPKNPEALQKLGGATGVAHLLSLNLSQGLTDNVRPQSQETFGKNILPAKNPPSLINMIFAAFFDKILLLLTGAAFMSLSIGIYQDVKEGTSTHWIEGAAILVAVIIVVLVNALNDYQRERQFMKLSAKSEDRLINILRGGKPDRISIFEVSVGDVVLLEPGEVLPADGIFIEGHNLQCDESSATGEVNSVKKDNNVDDPKVDPFLLSGTKVVDGNGSMLVIAVGERSFHGKMMMALREESSATPLQVKLDHLAENIAKLGASMALLMFLVLTIKYVIVLSLDDHPLPDLTEFTERLLLIIIETITIVVVAVPEGLPMAVTLALAYATTRMLKDNNLVRVLSACETMGNATSVCSDKTGTLTENKMTVVKGIISGINYKPSEVSSLKKKVDSKVIQLLDESISVNSTAFETSDPQTNRVAFVGNKTEIALLELLKKLGLDYVGTRNKSKILDVIPFSSERKTMTTVVGFKNPDDMQQFLRVHCKGASEIVLGRCKNWINADGSIEPLTTENIRTLQRFITEMAEESLRTIAIAFRELKEEASYERESLIENLILIGIVGIEDPLRDGVIEAVETCQNAGIFVRMVTGDNLLTAQSIAKKCGILMRGGIAMEGSRFRELDDKSLEEVIPRLQVLARSSPLDKQILVRKLKSMGEIVAVTGDGTNDGPALKSAHVGFAMGIAGTEVAKEASSIVLLDDNFASIVKAVAWGRSVNDSVRKFLQFQLTVNISAVLIAFITAVFDPNSRSILTTVQLLWINLIMDTFAALALATDRPPAEILKRHPDPPYRSLITVKMIKSIIIQAIFQVIAILLLVRLGDQLFHLPDKSSSSLILATMIFNSFVFLQLFNEINARVLDDRLNPFQGIQRNKVFIGIWIGTILTQVIIVCFGGKAFGTTPITPLQWLITIGIGALSLPMGVIARLLPDPPGWDSGPERVYMSRERLHWQAAIGDVRRSLAVFTAIRRARNTGIDPMNEPVQKTD